MSELSFAELPSTIVFYGGGTHRKEVLRITADGISVPPGVEVNEAAQAVLDALRGHITNLVNAEVSRRINSHSDTQENP